MIWYMIWYDMIWYDMIWYDMIWYDMIWYDMIWYDMIWYDTTWYNKLWYIIWYILYVVWYDIYLTATGFTPGGVVQYTFTHKQYIEQRNRLKQFIERRSSQIRNSADCAPSLWGLPWHLPYNWGKSAEKPQPG